MVLCVWFFLDRLDSLCLVFYRMDVLVSFGFLKDSDVGFLFFRIMDQKRFFWIVDLGFGFSQRIG